MGLATAKPKGGRGQFSKGWGQDALWKGFMEGASFKLNLGKCVCRTDWMGKGLREGNSLNKEQQDTPGTFE